MGPRAAAGLRVLVVNAGSSSLKVRALDPDNTVAFRADLPAPSDPATADALAAAMAEAGAVDAVGHRIVHGGDRFRAAVVVDEAVARELEELTDLAPLHNPPALAALHAARAAAGVPHVACFDTSFHAGLPTEAATFAVPWEWTQGWGLRRYGFHGLSHAYAARRAAELLGRPLEDLRTVTCHLGAGASLAAVAGGRSVDTTMGFTPLDGLVMATRSGSVDPGAVVWALRRGGLDADQLEDALDRRSGLLGLSGLSASPRDLYPAADGGHERARLALDVYLHRLCGSVAAMATAAGGLDVVVFTGGVGEHEPRLRAEAVARLAWTGAGLDAERNAGAEGDAVISGEGRWPAVCVVAAREDLGIAAEVRRLLA